MQIVLVVGRVLFVLTFIIHGVLKLTDISGMAQSIAGKVTVPPFAVDWITQLTTTTGMSTEQLVVIASGVIELVGGLLLAFGIGIRAVAVVLIAYTAVITYYLHDFWNMTGADRVNNSIHAEKNLVIIGGLLILFAFGRLRPAGRTQEFPT